MADDTIVVGAGGAAYVFVRANSGWVKQAELHASGSGLAISHDTIVIGGYGHNTDVPPFSGVADVFVREGASWTQQARLRASNAERDDYFGYSVAISGDTIVVGALGKTVLPRG